MRNVSKLLRRIPCIILYDVTSPSYVNLDDPELSSRNAIIDHCGWVIRCWHPLNTLWRNCTPWQRMRSTSTGFAFFTAVHVAVTSWIFNRRRNDDVMQHEPLWKKRIPYEYEERGSVGHDKFLSWRQPGHSKSRNEEMRNEKWEMGKWEEGTLHFTQQTADVLLLQSSLLWWESQCPSMDSLRSSLPDSWVCNSIASWSAS